MRWKLRICATEVIICASKEELLSRTGRDRVFASKSGLSRGEYMRSTLDVQKVDVYVPQSLRCRLGEDGGVHAASTRQYMRFKGGWHAC
jgi:hypothetical protein